MLDQVRQSFWEVLSPYKQQAWVMELAGILPLSALIDFVDLATILHMFQLRGKVPLWCWPVTPRGSRVLLHTDPTATGCRLDQANSKPKPICLDGRYGDMYPMANAETVRFCVEASPCRELCLPVSNMSSVNIQNESKRRLQQLEIVILTSASHCTDVEKGKTKSQSQYARQNFEWLLYYVVVALGWILWLCIVAGSILLCCWIALAFLLIVVLTGGITFFLHGRSPRQLGVRAFTSEYNRLVISASDMNETQWRAFYGQSDMVNPLLNWPMISARQKPPKIIFFLLRALVFGQWSMAIGAASTKGWDAYFISFWIILCILSGSYLFATPKNAKEWLRDEIGISIVRYRVTLSSRRAMLCALAALNPDTFPEAAEEDAEGFKLFQPDALNWIDPILKTGEARSKWQEAMRRALSSIGTPQARDVADCYENDKTCYWWKFVVEGVEIAELIRVKTNMSGRRVAP